MTYTRFAFALITLAAGLTLAGCGGATTSTNSNAMAASNKTNATSPAANASPASSAPAAKQGTFPNADFTKTAEDLHKDYKALFDKDPKSIETKYENKNIQISGRIRTLYPVLTGTGTIQVVALAGNGSSDDASCDFDSETVEFKTLQVGQTVTLQGVQTNNYNMTTPKLSKCYVIKDPQ